MRSFELQIEGQPPVPSPSRDAVIAALAQLHPKGPSFIVLGRDDGSYVQTAGSLDCFGTMKNCALILSVWALLLLAGCATSREDYTSGKSEICDVHGVRMAKTVVPIEYGLIRPTAKRLALYAASTNAFPHAETWVGGGCCVEPGSPRRALIYTCSECKRLRAQWEAEHDK